jgi:hypothetical protein
MSEPPISALIASFFPRLLALEAVVRIVLREARISSLVVLRGESPRTILLDFGSRPARVILDDATRPGDISMAIEAEGLHRILLGDEAPGLALGRRQMLLRGSALHFARFIPLFDFGPLLYREHLADLELPGFARSPRQLCFEDTEARMSDDERTFEGDPIPGRRLNWFERALGKTINAAAWALGWCVGKLRYSIFENLSLFDLMGAMSRGLEAAAPRRIEDKH